MAKRSQHVVPNPQGGWSVRQSGAARASKTFGTQAEAVKYGRTVAKRAQSEFYVHRNDGTIREKNSYAQDPFPPRDKR